MKKYNKRKKLIFINVVTIGIIFLLLLAMLELLINHNRKHTTTILKKENITIYYPKFDNPIDDVLEEFLNTVDSSKVDKISYETAENNSNISIILKLFKEKKVVDYKSFIFNSEYKVVDILNLIINKEEFENQIKSRLTIDNITFNETQYNFAKRTYYLKNNSLEIYFSNFDENLSVFNISIDLSDLKNCLNLNIDLLKVEDPTQPVSNKKLIAFTFDDGPSIYTLELMALLAQYDAKATFFQVGYMIKARPGMVSTLISNGFEVGNHTIDHSRLTKFKSADKIIEKISQNNELYKSITEFDMKLIRPPYGAYNDLVSKSLDGPIILWSLDSQDWKSRNRDKIVEKVMSNIKEGDIVLFHDLYSETLEAVKTLLPILIDGNYQIVTVSTLFENKDLGLEPGKIYRKAE